MFKLETLLWTYLEKVEIDHLTIEHDSGVLDYRTIGDCLRNCPRNILDSAAVDARWCWNTLLIVVDENEPTT